MADLGSKSTDGRISFIKYVTSNPKYSEIDFEIERNKNAQVYIKKSNNIIPDKTILKPGTKLKITNPKIIEQAGLKLAAIKVQNKTGYIPINTIRKPTGGNGTQYEDEVVDAINSYISKAGGSIDLKLKGSAKLYKNMRYAVKVDASIKRKGGVKGDPKADIIICEDLKNPLESTSVFISHKKEGGPEAFQQYGGLSEQASLDIYNNRLVQKFLGEVAKILGGGDKLPYPVMATFNDPHLANMSIYGPDFGKKFSLQHVQMIGQGHPVFTDKGSHVEMGFSSHMSLSGNLSFFTGGYLPVFGATFRAGRGFTYKNNRYNGARVAIYPKKLIETRSGIVKLDLK